MRFVLSWSYLSSCWLYPQISGHLFTKWMDVLPQNLVKSRSRGIWVQTFPITLKCGRHQGSSAAEIPFNSQNDRIIITSNIAASRLHDFDRLVNRGPGLLHWHWGDRMIVPMPVKQSRSVWMTSNETENTTNLEPCAYMMTSSNGDIFRCNGPLWGESTGRRWNPFTKAIERSFDVFFDLHLNKR